MGGVLSVWWWPWGRNCSLFLWHVFEKTCNAFLRAEWQTIDGRILQLQDVCECLWGRHICVSDLLGCVNDSETLPCCQTAPESRRRQYPQQSSAGRRLAHVVAGWAWTRQCMLADHVTSSKMWAHRKVKLDTVHFLSVCELLCFFLKSMSSVGFFGYWVQVEEWAHPNWSELL